MSFLNRSLLHIRIALAICILGGIAVLTFYALFRPSPANTFGVFYAAAQSALDGKIEYDTVHGLFVYTPIVLLYFIPYALLVDLPTAVLLQRAVSIIVAIMYGVLLVRALDDRRELASIDRALILGFMTVSIYPIVVYVLAGIEILLGALLGVGFLLLERDRDAEGGALWAIASLFKVFPAFWGVYYLLRRNGRAVAGAAGTGVAATVVGVALFGLDSYLRYFESTTGNRVRLQKFAGGASPDTEEVTLIRPLSQLFPTVDPGFWVPLIAIGTALLLGYLYWRTPQSTFADRAALLLGTVIAVEFVMPTSQDLDMYLLLGPLVLLMYTERDELVQSGLAVATVVFTYNIGREELSAVSSVFGPEMHDLTMAIGRPILSFASMPLWGMLFLFGVLLIRARRRSGQSVVEPVVQGGSDVNPSEDAVRR